MKGKNHVRRFPFAITVGFIYQYGTSVVWSECLQPNSKTKNLVMLNQPFPEFLYDSFSDSGGGFFHL